MEGIRPCWEFTRNGNSSPQHAAGGVNKGVVKSVSLSHGVELDVNVAILMIAAGLADVAAAPNAADCDLISSMPLAMVNDQPLPCRWLCCR